MMYNFGCHDGTVVRYIHNFKSKLHTYHTHCAAIWDNLLGGRGGNKKVSTLQFSHDLEFDVDVVVVGNAIDAVEFDIFACCQNMVKSISFIPFKLATSS
jgi:hypothetical protein